MLPMLEAFEVPQDHFTHGQGAMQVSFSMQVSFFANRVYRVGCAGRSGAQLV